MNKYIVITTINSPTIATKKFISFKDWTVIIVGDKKTPHKEYQDLDCIYLHPDYQEKTYKDLSDLIGWNTPARRSLGYIEAYIRGANILATVDDDNIPYDNWGKDILLGKEIEIDCWDSELDLIDPLEVTNHKDLWHRGYPIDLVRFKNQITYIGKKKITPLIQANLWDGDPDIDAINRLTKRPLVKFDIKEPFCFTKISPFNSQNTLLSRKVIPYYMMIPCVGRMDDIWGGYILQDKFKNSLIYANATVYQDRNKQDLVKNLEDEILGYRHTLNLIKSSSLINNEYMPKNAKLCYKEYRKNFNI